MFTFIHAVDSELCYLSTIYIGHVNYPYDFRAGMGLWRRRGGRGYSNLTRVKRGIGTALKGFFHRGAIYIFHMVTRLVMMMVV